MTLLLEEIKTVPVGQKIIPSSNYNVEAIRPHIYKHNSAAGSLVLTISDTNGNQIAQSNAVPINSISTSPFFHGHVRFDIFAYLEAGVEYYIRLQGANGYSFSESAYIGFCKDFDFHTYPTSYSPADGLSAPFDLEVWARSPR